MTRDMAKLLASRKQRNRMAELAAIISEGRATAVDIAELQTLLNGEKRKRKARFILTAEWLDKQHAAVQAAASNADTLLFCGQTPRFGARVKGSNVSLVIQWRPPATEGARYPSRRHTLALWPTDLDAARAEAKRLLKFVDAGLDPLVADRQEEADKEAASQAEAARNRTMKQLVDDYRERQLKGLISHHKTDAPLAPSTIRTDGARLRHIAAFFGDMLAREVDEQKIQDFKDHLKTIDEGETQAKGTARVLGTLSALMTWAARRKGDYPGVKHGLQGVKVPAGGSRDVSLSQEQYGFIGAALRNEAARNRAPWQLPHVVRLLALTGCRPGEILRLKWREVDFNGRALRLQKTKTGKSIRPMPEPVAAILKGLEAEWGKERSEFVFFGDKPGGSWQGEKVPWYRIIGHFHAMDEAAAKARGDLWDKPDMTLHGFRHAYKTLCHEMGIGEITSKAILGHSLGTEASTGYIDTKRVDAIALRESNRVATAIDCFMRGETNVVPLHNGGQAHG